MPMTPTDITAWMNRLGLNKAQAASALGIARSTLDRYLSGDKPIPRVVELACIGVVELACIAIANDWRSV